MANRLLLFICLHLLSCTVIQGQCPARDVVWKRICFFRDSSSIAPSADQQLKELLGYEQAMASCLYRYDSTHALLLQRIGVLYFRQSNLAKALSYSKQSVNITKSNTGKPFVNPKHLIRGYYILSAIYDSLGNILEEMRAIDTCILFSVNLNSIDVYTLYMLRRKAEYLYGIGDYHQVIECANMGELLTSRYGRGTDSLNHAAAFLIWKVNALITLRNFETAETLLRDKINGYKKPGGEHYLGSIYELLAQVNVEKKDYIAANSFFELAFKYDDLIGEKLGCKQILTNWGYYLYFKHEKNYPKAIQTYKKALQFLLEYQSSGTEKQYELLNIYGNIAKTYTQQSRYDSAASYFQKAFDQIKLGLNEKRILEDPIDTIQYKRMRYLVGLLIDKGESYSKRYTENKQQSDILNAIQIFQSTDRLLDRIRADQTEAESKLFWRADNRHLYEDAIEACYLAGQAEQGFYFFEKSHAALLIDQLKEQRWLNNDDILQLARLKKKALQLKRELGSTNNSSPQYAATQTALFNNSQELGTIEQLIKVRNPLYYHNIVDTSSLSFRDVRNSVLKDGGTFLEFFSGDNSVYEMMITQMNVLFRKINKMDFDSSSSLYISYISNSSLLNRDFEGFVNIANHLYQLIFGNEQLPSGRIIVSLDGRYFPFESLVTTKNHSDPGYFVSDHPVSYTYSAGYLVNNMAAPPAESEKSFIGIAPVNYNGFSNLSSLNGSDKSLNKIQSYFNQAKNLLFTEASGRNFLQQFAGYRILQLYTHSSATSSHNEPVIYFADSALYLSDLVAGTKPATQLIVLAACETGNGKFYEGEGVFSFNRGFAALGIPSSVTNLWTIDNESTYKITELFYKYVADGLALDVALQKAKLEFIKTSPDRSKQLPYYWAASVLVGNTDSIQIPRSSKWPYYAAAAGIPVLLVGLFVFIRKRRRVTPTPDITETAS